MPRDAAVLVEQFLETGEPQARRNAVIALAAVGTPETVGRLVDLAAGGDGPVRDQALAELAALPASKGDALRAALEVRMADPARAGAVYMLQGRLRAAGVELGGESADPRMRLRRAMLARDELRASAGWRHGVIARAFAWAMAALVVMAALAFALAPGSGLRADSMLPAVKRLLEVGWLLALVLGVLGSRAATPFGAYPDRAAAAAVEVGAMLLWGVAAFVAVLLSVSLVALFEKNLELATAGDAGSWAVFALACVVFPAAVRLGTLAASGALEPKRWDAVLRVATGASLGIMAVSLILALDVPRKVGGGAVMPAALRGWAVMVPSAFALAWAMVLVDASGPRSVLGGRRWRLVASVLVSLLVAAWFAAPLLAWARMPRSTDDTWQVTALPASREVEVRGLRLVTVEAPHDGKRSLGQDLVAEIWSGSQEIASRDDPPHVKVAVDSGTYEVRLATLNSPQTVALGRTLDISGIFPLMAGYIPILGLRWGGVREVLAKEGHRVIRVPIRQASADTAGPELVALSARETGDWRISDALDRLDRARRDPRVRVESRALYDICWRGALLNLAKAVLPVCDEAVAMDGTNAMYRDGRGLARVLTGDLPGAIDDFEVYMAAAVEGGLDVSRHQGWMAELRRGRNPIDETVLAQLRKEENDEPAPPEAPSAAVIDRLGRSWAAQPPQRGTRPR